MKERRERALARGVMMKKFQPYWLAKFDHASVVVPGLFRSLNKGTAERKQSLFIEHVFEDSKTAIRIRSPELLGGDDLKVLQGLVGIATEAARPYCNALQEFYDGGRDDRPEPVKAQCTCLMPELRRASGYKSRSTTGYDGMRQSIRRLARVMIEVVKQGATVPSNAEPFLTIHRLDDEAPNVVDVGFHAALGAAILAVGDGEVYVKVNLDEARLHGSIPARVLHHRLSYLNEGREQEFRPRTLEAYIWPGEDLSSADRARTRRSAEAAAAFKALQTDSGWTVEEDVAKGLVSIRRKRDARSNPLNARRHAERRRRSSKSDAQNDFLRHAQNSF